MTAPLRVIKLGGRVHADPALAAAIARAWNDAPASLCIVHGGGDALSALQRVHGREPRFVNGLRITEPADIELVRMALSGAVNKQLVSALVAAAVSAVGISGEDAGLLRATRRASELGMVGTPSWVDPGLLRHLLAAGYLPVIAPVARNAESDGTSPTDITDRDARDAGALNVNADDAAVAIAAALGAGELLLVADVPGVVVGGAAAPWLAAADARAAIARRDVTGGMVAKLEAALAALARGVPVVRIGGTAMIGDANSGTRLTVRAEMAA